jgi:D-alanine-D-alanine ligase
VSPSGPSDRQLAVVFGGPSAESEVSVLTGLQALAELGPPSVGIYWDRSGRFWLVKGVPEPAEFAKGLPKGCIQVELMVSRGFEVAGGLLPARKPLRVDAVVNCCHGGPGEDGTLQSVLDLAGIPYTGPRPEAASICMDKYLFSQVVGALGLPVLPRVLLAEDGDVPAPLSAHAGPFIMKPRFGGSSIGVEVVADLATAQAMARSHAAYTRGAVVEPYREDLFDAQVAVRAYPRLEVSAIERPIRKGAKPVLSFEDKYAPGEGMAGAARELPARIPEALVKQIREAAEAIACQLSLTGIWRIDFLTNGEDELYVNEVNTIPGSLARHLFIEPKRSFSELLADMVEEAVAVSTRRNWEAHNVRTDLLASSRSLAAKLLEPG